MPNPLLFLPSVNVWLLHYLIGGLIRKLPFTHTTHCWSLRQLQAWGMRRREGSPSRAS